MSTIGCSSDVDNPSVSLPETDNALVPCLSYSENENTLEVLTWNIEHFPKHTETTEFVNATIIESGYDVWGLQEIEQTGKLDQIKQLDERYDVIVDEDIAFGVNDDYHLAFVYRTDHLEVLSKEILASGDFESYFFPRKPLLVTFKDKTSGQEFTVINLHMKCCSGETNNYRRSEGAKRLKDYLDSNYANEKVIVLGDFNHTIIPSNTSDYKVFIDDRTNYQFSDEALARSDDPLNWSYPGWPSHIDHILMTDEFFDGFVDAYTLTLDECSGYYDPKVSDHRPVLSVFSN
ncbi:endonuclease/exonuclease/phosphatase family protein [Flammeovirga agarivorans]|uniref:Endonuclease/exonuclease/phosphatase domain-containing protein n=1 Tax=Flammeovirga agarivorans TaxID=2726742 RepID=A0A7X8XYY5_9BACT|nr:endonuclease/exonuclease/phosphatase family protein [Flammeovirga agarivorans]NLR94578.1 hypothetical protein [Flammeovirga agarivorans]